MTKKKRFQRLIGKTVEYIVAAITQYFLVVLVGASVAAIYAFAKKTFYMIIQLLTEPSQLWVTILLITLYALYSRLLVKKKPKES